MDSNLQYLGIIVTLAAQLDDQPCVRHDQETLSSGVQEPVLRLRRRREGSHAQQHAISPPILDFLGLQLAHWNNFLAE